MAQSRKIRGKLFFVVLTGPRIFALPIEAIGLFAGDFLRATRAPYFDCSRKKGRRSRYRKPFGAEKNGLREEAVFNQIST